MRPLYKAVLFAPDGDWVTDYRGCSSIEEVQDRVADQGSRWFFYPFSAVIRDHGPMATSRQRLVDMAEPFEDMRGLAIHTVSKWLKTTAPEVMEILLA